MTPATKDAYNLLHQGALALAQIEHNGIRIDVPYLEATIADVDERIRKLQDLLKADPLWADWKKAFREKANLGSGKQLAALLFDKKHLGLPYPHEFTRTGQYRSDEEVFGKVDHPFVKKYAKLLKLTKLNSTYLRGVLREVVDGYIHPSFNLHTVRTFRSSSDSPNFQNMPIRDPELGGLIRKAFIARKGRHLVEIDFKGVEVGVAACYNQDPNLIAYVKDPTKDMHRDMACEIFQLSPKEVTKAIRYTAKQFVFAEFYGSVFFQCAKPLWESAAKLPLGEGTVRDHLKAKGIKKLGETTGLEGESTAGGIKTERGTFVHHVRDVEEDFWTKRFPAYAVWKKKVWEEYLERGWFDLLTGFREKGLYSRNDVINHRVQGAASHCKLWVLIQLQKWLTEKKMRARLIGEIHDSIEADVPPEELQTYLNKVKELVEVELPKAWDWIVVPLTVEVEVSEVDGNWFEKKSWVLQNGRWGPESDK